jgi:hypothetical protein
MEMINSNVMMDQILSKRSMNLKKRAKHASPASNRMTVSISMIFPLKVKTGA